MVATRKAIPKSILFVGNSFTARNDLIGMIHRMAADAGHDFDHAFINRGGASLRTHWNAGAAVAAIRSGKFDTIVLQEQSTLPVKNAARMRESILLFNDAIVAAGCRTVLYMTWARRNAPDAQQAITDAYASIGKEIAATVVPVGVAWKSFLGSYDAPPLHERDQSHPTLAGSYLAACVFLATLFGANPTKVKSDVAGLTNEDRQRLEDMAWRTVRPPRN